jgi:aryl-alcohol dehydrogenase-like predicted oxidoreductase
MKYGNVPGISKPISRLAQGTATFFNPADPADCYEMLDLSTEFGINTFDTAHCYGAEKSIMFGKWLKDRKMADKVVILAKGAHPYGHPRVTQKDITSDLEATLEWMQVDYVDLLVLHRDDPAVPVGPIVEILNEHQKAGKIGAFGGSNWSHRRIEEANNYARENGLTPFAVSSPNYSLAEQIEEPWADCLSISGPGGDEAREWYGKSDVALFPWSSLAAGFFSGRYHKSDEVQLENDRSTLDFCLRCYASHDNFERLDRTEKVAKAKGLLVPQIALAYVMQQPLDIYALISCDGRPQFEANVAALNLKLTDGELAYLDLKAPTF